MPGVALSLAAMAVVQAGEATRGAGVGAMPVAAAGRAAAVEEVAMAVHRANEEKGRWRLAEALATNEARRRPHEEGLYHRAHPSARARARPSRQVRYFPTSSYLYALLTIVDPTVRRALLINLSPFESSTGLSRALSRRAAQVTVGLF